MARVSGFSPCPTGEGGRRIAQQEVVYSLLPMADCCIPVSKPRSTKKHMLYGRELTPFDLETQAMVKKGKEEWDVQYLLYWVLPHLACSAIMLIYQESNAERH